MLVRIHQVAPGRVTAKVKFAGNVPKQLEVKLRFPKGAKVGAASVNGKQATLAQNEAVLIETGGQKEFIVEARSG